MASLARYPLAPLSWLFRAGVRLRNGLYDRGLLRSDKLAVPVVSVGNLTTGGSGKTPFVAYLASRFSQAGWRVAVASRGYGGNPGRVPLLVSAGAGPLVTAVEAGDEPVLLAHLHPGLIVVVDPDRASAARFAIEQHAAQIVILDDGFQHRRLQRDLDLVMINAREGFGNGKMLPLGPLREPLGALTRSQAAVLTGAVEDLPGGENVLRDQLRRLGCALPVFSCERRVKGLVDLPGGERVRDSDFLHRRALVFSGIAHPGAFEADLENLGIEIGDRIRYRDHQILGSREVAQIEARAKQVQPDCLITTEKDWRRLEAFRFTLPTYALQIELVPRDENSLWSLVTSRIPPSPGTRG